MSRELTYWPCPLEVYLQSFPKWCNTWGLRLLKVGKIAKFLKDQFWILLSTLYKYVALNRGPGEESLHKTDPPKSKSKVIKKWHILVSSSSWGRSLNRYELSKMPRPVRSLAMLSSCCPGLDQPGPWPGHQIGKTKPWPTSSLTWPGQPGHQLSQT